MASGPRVPPPSVIRALPDNYARYICPHADKNRAWMHPEGLMASQQAILSRSAMALLASAWLQGPAFAQTPVPTVSQVEGHWTQCVQEIRDKNGRPPSSGIFGPRFEVNSSRFVCQKYWDLAKAAIVTEQQQAGLPTSPKQLSRLFDEAKKRVAAGLVEPGTSRSLESQTTETANAGALATRSCKGSVNRGLKAHQSGDNELALCYWLPKARAGDPAAQNNMGILFEGGLSVQTPQDDSRATEWYLLAAQQGFLLAIQNLTRVHLRLGNNDAANSWAQAAAVVSQQQAIQQQQAAQDASQAW